MEDERCIACLTLGKTQNVSLGSDKDFKDFPLCPRCAALFATVKTLDDTISKKQEKFDACFDNLRQNMKLRSDRITGGKASEKVKDGPKMRQHITKLMDQKIAKRVPNPTVSEPENNLEVAPPIILPVPSVIPKVETHDPNYDLLLRTFYPNQVSIEDNVEPPPPPAQNTETMPTKIKVEPQPDPEDDDDVTDVNKVFYITPKDEDDDEESEDEDENIYLPELSDQEPAEQVNPKVQEKRGKQKGNTPAENPTPRRSQRIRTATKNEDIYYYYK